MPEPISPQLLRSLRNDIPIEKLIVQELKIPHKRAQGVFRFLCPLCREFNTSTKKKTNLARCFRCKKNFNPIDMVMGQGRKTFLEAVTFLKPIWIQCYKEKIRKIL